MSKRFDIAHGVEGRNPSGVVWDGMRAFAAWCEADTSTERANGIRAAIADGSSRAAVTVKYDGETIGVGEYADRLMNTASVARDEFLRFGGEAAIHAMDGGVV